MCGLARRLSVLACRVYVAMTRGRDDNRVYVVTDTHDMSDARDVLERIVASDRADV